MAAFKSVDAALDYTRTLQENTGHHRYKSLFCILIHVEEDDVFGGPKNLATHVVGSTKVWKSGSAIEQKKTLIGSVPQNPND
jgi:hypothetical protein